MVAGTVGARTIAGCPVVFAQTRALMAVRRGCSEGVEVIRYAGDRSRIER
jgi:hypothetical protein